MVESRKARKGLGGMLRTGVVAGAAALGYVGLQKASADVTESRGPDVLLVSFDSALGKDFGQNPGLIKYENALRKEGLSSTYVALDAPVALQLYDHSVQQGSKTMVFTDGVRPDQYSVTYSEAWEADKAVLNRVEERVNPKYVIILGGTTIMPMPLEGIPVDEHHSWEKIYPKNMVPSDEPYGSYANYNDFISVSRHPKQEFIVARMPGDNATEVGTMLESAAERHESPNTKTMISTIAHSFVGRLGHRILDPFNYLTVLTYQFEKGVRKHDDGQNRFLLLPEDPYSTSIDGKSGLRRDELMQYVSTYGIQFYVSVGDGAVSHVFPDEQHTIVESTHIPKLSGHPIVFNMGCYNGNIDRAFVDEYNQTNVPALAHSFMVNGAAVYIGDTVETAVEWPKIYFLTALPQEKGSIPEMISTYEHFKGNETIGEAFIEMRNTWGQSDSQISQSGARMLQLYGDPTLRK